MGKYSEAIKKYEKAVHINTNNDNAWNNIGKIKSLNYYSYSIYFTKFMQIFNCNYIYLTHNSILIIVLIIFIIKRDNIFKKGIKRIIEYNISKY